MTFGFNSFEPAAKLNYVIEGVRRVGFQPLGLGCVMVTSHACFIKDFRSHHEALLAGAELISLPCPSPDVAIEVPGPRLDYLPLRIENCDQIEVALFLSKCTIIKGQL